MNSAFTGDKHPVPSLDVTGIKLRIMTAADEYAQAMMTIERLGNIPMKDPKFREAMRNSQAKYKELHDAISHIDSL